MLKSSGIQYYSYTNVADAVAGLLYVLLLGENGAAYNIADVASDITLKDLAEMIAEIAGKKVVYEIPNHLEAAGYSKTTNARLDGSKLKSIGRQPKYNIRNGVERTISILKRNTKVMKEYRAQYKNEKR